MRPVVAYRDGRPNGQATVPVYLAAIQEYGWEAVHRQTLTELADWLTHDRQNLSPMQIAEYADQWQRPLLIAVQNACSPEVQPTLATVEALARVRAALPDRSARTPTPPREESPMRALSSPATTPDICWVLWPPFRSTSRSTSRARAPRAPPSGAPAPRAIPEGRFRPATLAPS